MGLCPLKMRTFRRAPNDATKLQIVICEDTSLLAGGGVVATVGGSCRELARAVTGRSSQLGTFPARACAGDEVSVCQMQLQVECPGRAVTKLRRLKTSGL